MRHEIEGVLLIQPRISVVVPTKNEESRLSSCLRAIQAQSVKPIEVLVVDGQSTDGTVEMGHSLGATVLSEDYGTRAGACQVGAVSALGEYVAFTDADCVPDSHWLENLICHFSGDAAGIGGRIVNMEETLWQESVNVALDTLLGSANSVQGRNFSTKRSVSSISGCNSIYRREDILAVGGFRTDLLTAEDAELNKRLLRRGKLVYVPDAVVFHHHGRDLGDFAKRMFQYGYGRGQVPSFGAPVMMSILAPITILLAIFFPLFTTFLIAAYVSSLFASSAWVCIKKRRLRFLGTLPVVYTVEHACYVTGFWVGILARLAPARRRVRANQGNAL